MIKFSELYLDTSNAQYTTLFFTGTWCSVKQFVTFTVFCGHNCNVLFVVEWRKEELTRINETLSGAERKAALCMLLDQETQLLASIGKRKVEADAENREKFIQDFLEKVSTVLNIMLPD